MVSIGGKAFAQKTRNALKYILTDILCRKLSWSGQKGSMAIKNTAFADIILGNYYFLKILVTHVVLIVAKNLRKTVNSLISVVYL